MDQEDWFKLEQNIPNPYSGQTRIPLRLSKAAEVELYIFDTMGRQVYQSTKWMNEGYQEWILDELQVNGVLHVVVQIGAQKQSIRMINLD